MIPINPYIAGNPVGGGEAFIGRADVLREVVRVLRSPSENALVLYGQRRIGKTSVLQELVKWLPRIGVYYPIYFDLQNKAARSLTEVLRELAARIAQELGLPALEFQDENLSEVFRTKFLSKVLAHLPPKSSLILLFDEFDVLDTPNEAQAGAAFFPYLRDLLFLDSRLQFVFVIGRRPEDLSSLTLSVFKGVKSYPVSLLSPQETAELVRLAERNSTLQWPNEAVTYVYTLTGGHPFLTQQLCQEIWERAYQDASEMPPKIHLSVIDEMVPVTLGGATNALEWLWDGLRPAERVVASALAEAGPVGITQTELEQRLQESGVRILIGELQNAPRILQNWNLITSTDSGYRFRVELLRRWITNRKPLARVQEEIDRIKPVAENLFLAAYSLYQGGNLKGAIPLLRQATGLNPNHLRANQLLAEILLAQGEVSEARQLLESLYEYHPAIARPRLVQALLLRAKTIENKEVQLALYERVLRLEPSQPEAIAGQQSIWEERGDEAFAANYLMAALRNYQRAGLSEKADQVETELRYRRLEAELQELAGLQQEGKYSIALDLARQLYEKYPQERDKLPDLELIEHKTHLDNLYSQALVALQAGDQQTAQEMLAQVIVREPRYREATRYLHLAVTGVDVVDLQTRLENEGQMRQELEPTTQAKTTIQKSVKAHLFLFVLSLMGHLRLFWWLFMAPQRPKMYQEQFEKKIMRRYGNWLASTLIWLPLIFPTLALGLRLLPQHTNAWSSTTYLWLSGVLFLGWFLTGWSSDRKGGLLSVMAFILSGILAGIVAVSVVGVVASSMISLVIFVVVLILAAIIAGFVADTVAISVGVGAVGGVAGGIAGSIVGGTAGLVAFITTVVMTIVVAVIVAVVVEKNLYSRHPSWMMRGISGTVLLAHTFIAWYIFLGGWQLV